MASVLLNSDIENPFEFAILIGGFIPRDPEISNEFFKEKPLIEIPSLHIFGEKDEIILPKESERLSEVFSQDYCKKAIHSGGHYIPTNSEFIQQHFIPFFNEILSWKK
jgi:predicted esterase